MTTEIAVDEFEVLMEPEEDGGYHVWCPALPGCHSEGETLDQARSNILEAIELWLDSADDLGDVLRPLRERVRIQQPEPAPPGA